MKEADFINKSDTGDTELEFGNLLELGIAKIQQLAGNDWTDFNTHDPGITILEQLCFAVTELGYKTNFDIKDLLASQQNQADVDDTFFSASDMLLGRPISTLDFRKVLIDRVDGLRNVWVEPLNLASGKHTIKGTYTVLINPSSAIIRTDEDREKLITETRNCLEKFSNLGESFEEIIVLEQEEIIVSGEIELENEANADRTHAQILFNIKHFISSPVSFSTIAEMQALGYSYEEIFEGPKLHHGFIKDEDLKDKITTLLTSHLITVILEVEGVSKVRSLTIQEIGKKNEEYAQRISKPEMDDGVVIDLNKVAVLAKKMIPYNPGYIEFISYRQNQETAILFKDNVIRFLRQIENENKVNYALLHDKVHDVFRTKGTSKSIADYYSIQEHFPAIYATGNQGIPPSFNPERANKVKQLKTYLLTFEQILTNYLAQLSHFSTLFSLDENLTQTYFAGTVASIPHVKDLMFGLEETKSDTEIEAVSRKISSTALQTIDDFYERRHQALDHLLARFGERQSNFAIARFNYYYSQEDHLKRMISSKVNLLKELPFISAKRARSFNSQKKIWKDTQADVEFDNPTTHQNISYLEKKAKIRLGIQSANKKFSAYLQQQIGEWKQAKILSPQRLGRQLTRENRDDGRLVLHSIWSSGQHTTDFMAGIEIDDELLRRGVWPNNFKIITDKKDKKINWLAFSKKLFFNTIDIQIQKNIEEKLLDATRDLDPKPRYIRFMDDADKDQPLLIEFQQSTGDNYHAIPTNVWRILKSFQTHSEAQEYSSGLINYLRELNINTEGFHLVDHIELRPRSKENLYGILLKDDQTHTGFVSAKKYNYVNIQRALIELIHQARKAQYIHEGEGKTRLVYQKETIGHYKTLHQTQIPDNNQREKDLKHLFNSLTDFDLHDPSVIQFYYESKINETIGSVLFYSFRVSIIIPDWPARFADPEFRKVMEKTIREDMPAHIGLDFYYLPFEKLKQFELLFDNWLHDLRKLLRNHPEKINKSSDKLALFIQKLEGK